jgi:hypothetical protein
MFELDNDTSPQQVKLSFYNSKSLLHNLVWHSYAMGSVFGVLFLLIGSLMFLNLNWLVKNVMNYRKSKFNIEILRSFSDSVSD